MNPCLQKPLNTAINRHTHLQENYFLTHKLHEFDIFICIFKSWDFCLLIHCWNELTDHYLGFLVPLLTDTKLLLKLLLQAHTVPEKTTVLGKFFTIWPAVNKKIFILLLDIRSPEKQTKNKNITFLRGWALKESHLSFCLALLGRVCMLNWVRFLRSLSLRRFLCS